MLCPKCRSLDDKVIDSRLSKEGNSIRRRRECLNCAHRFTTYEEMEHLETFVIKRDGRRENLDRQKLLGSFLKACEKRPVPLEKMENAISEILGNLDTIQQREIPTKFIGDQVMEQLRHLDPVAYVRYASVYRCFEEIGEFIEEIRDYQRAVGSQLKGLEV